MSKGVSISRVRIVIFAKAPLPGLAKTRLIPALGEQGTAALARRMLLHTVEQALAASAGPVELCATPSPNAAVWESLPIPPGVQWSEQGEGDLGMRMARAAQRVTAAGQAVLLIGSDCPSLDAAQLRRAAAALQHFDATLVPTADGGYVLLGLNRFDVSLFEGVVWSTGGVAAATLERLERLGWKTQKYATVHDIDEPADLKWVPPRWLESMEEGERQLNGI
jgi:rSAM/selenodomain-associated transferase 1